MRFFSSVFQRDAVDDVQRVEDIALGLGHLLAFAVAHQAVHVHLAEGHVAHEFQAEHHHARDPEEDDVEARDQHIAGIEALEVGVGLGPAQRGIGPQRRREPRVEDVGVRVSATSARACPGLCPRLGFAARDEYIAGLVVPGGNLVTPPQLAADAPVADVAHPLEVGLRPVLGHEADAPGLHRLDGGSGQRFDPHVPLVGEQRLEDRAAAIAARHHQLVLVDALDGARGFHLGQHDLARLPRAAGRQGARGTLSLSRASGVKMLISGRPWRAPTSLSVKSCAGVIFTTPEPNLRSTKSSPMTGISRSASGRRTRLPMRWR